MEVISTMIKGEEYFSFKKGGIIVGKCIIKKRDINVVHLKYILIFIKFRGNQLATKFWKLVEDKLRYNGVKKITLLAEEFDEKHGKLQKLYEAIGFRIDGKINYGYNGDYLMRRIPMVKEIN